MLLSSFFDDGVGNSLNSLNILNSWLRIGYIGSDDGSLLRLIALIVGSILFNEVRVGLGIA